VFKGKENTITEASVHDKKRTTVNNAAQNK
jgi:hypothetical protein